MDMTIKALHHVSVVVDDLAAAIAFFTALGMTVEGERPVEGPWVDRVNGLEGVRVDIVLMRTPDGHGRLELTRFRNPKLVEIEPAIAPPNTPGLRSVMFTVESVDDTVARLRANGAELVGEVVQYEDVYRLCYMRGPCGYHRRPGRGTLTPHRLQRNCWAPKRFFDLIGFVMGTK
jgi:catechol 2,3-dioxygenase-like lactoylglutathione lyase family enzyme